jgi:hypothetical protein
MNEVAGSADTPEPAGGGRSDRAYNPKDGPPRPPEAWAETGLEKLLVLDRAELRGNVFDGLTASQGSRNFGERLVAAAEKVDAKWKNEQHEPTFDERMGQVDRLRTATKVLDGADAFDRAANAAVKTLDVLEQALEAAPDARRRSEVEHLRHEMVGFTLQSDIGSFATDHDAEPDIAQRMKAAWARDAGYLGQQLSFEHPLAVYANVDPEEQPELSVYHKNQANAALEAREEPTTDHDPLTALDLGVDHGRFDLVQATRALEAGDMAAAMERAERAIVQFRENNAGGMSAAPIGWRLI